MKLQSMMANYEIVEFIAIEYQSDDVMAFCYSIVMVLNKPCTRLWAVGWSRALVLLATVVITDPWTA